MPVNGLEVQQSDLNLLGQVSASADDAVFSELLRMTPFASSPPAKAILPYGVAGQTKAIGIVTAPGTASGTVTINPFRAFIGSRSAATAGAIANWNDIRSVAYVGSSTSLTGSLAFAGNLSGNPRWDLIYAAVAIDANGPTVTRFVKDPTSKIVNSQSVVTTVATSITVGIAQGTPAPTPVRPSLPTDTTTTFYIPLAYVRVLNGFGPTTVVLVDDIQDDAPTIKIARSTGACQLSPANQSHGAARTVLTHQPWPTAPGSFRPSGFLPPTMVGSDQIFFTMNLNATPTHVNGDIIDSSRDWRNRLFLGVIQVGSPLNQLATDLPFPINYIPGPKLGSPNISDAFVWMGNSIATSSVARFTQVQLSQIASGSSEFDFLVDGNGSLKLQTIGPSANVVVFCWIMATAQIPF